jgi:moderate conductance mechanosensitive channel
MERIWNREWVEANFADLGGRVLVALLIIVAGWLLARLAARAVYTAIMRHERGQTLAPLTRSTVHVVLLGITLVMALDQVGVPVGAVLAGAGVVGIAIGFGAQSLVKDVITGFFHIMQGVIQVGDVAQIGEVTGLVEEVSLRLTKVRAFNGQLWYVPNGSIERVGSFNRGWCRAVAEVGVAYEHDVARALKVLQQVGEEFQKEKPTLVLERPEAQGIMGLNASDVGLRLVVKVKAQEHWATERELRLRIKQAFDREGVEIPFPRRVVYHRSDT